MIDGHTQLVGLMGWPVEHTLSPAMHNAAFDALELNWRYLPLPVQPGQVEAAVKGVAALGFRDANVTVLHKQAVMPSLDSIASDTKTLMPRALSARCSTVGLTPKRKALLSLAQAVERGRWSMACLRRALKRF